jgi:hypothetical protein
MDASRSPAERSSPSRRAPFPSRLPSRRVAAVGVLTTASLAGGLLVGTASAVNNPFGLAVDGAGNVYLADTGNQEIEKVTATGQLTISVGTGNPGPPTPGPATSSRPGLRLRGSRRRRRATRSATTACGAWSGPGKGSITPSPRSAPAGRPAPTENPFSSSWTTSAPIRPRRSRRGAPATTSSCVSRRPLRRGRTRSSVTSARYAILC